ncbi:MAG: chromate efflux transporter [Phycisphaerales bacterium]|nr:chromate efflux transporter [Phycisphaerales bacterium]
MDVAGTNPSASHPSFGEALRFWLKLGFISFGGPTGQIAIMHEELVERKRWISESRFLHALNYCMLLPGPEAQQLAIYIGWLLHRTLGGIVAGTLFVLPAVFILWTLSYVYVTYGQVAWVESLFYGLKPAVMAVVAAAVWRIGGKALKNGVMWSLAGLAFVAIYFFRVPFPVIVLGAGLIGLIGSRVRADLFVVIRGHGGASPGAAVLADHHESPDHARPSLGRAARVILVAGALWWAPVLAAAGWRGWDDVLVKVGLFFSKAAMVTFGGAYAVLPYVAQQAVERFEWLTGPQMLDGLGLAETTPGPLIMVVQWVGFLGGYHQPGVAPPLLNATLAALMTTWVTFAPCFLWIFLGAPYIERLRGSATLSAALSAITAAVVGVVLNLAVWFALQVVLPKAGGVDVFAILVGAAALLALTRLKWNLIPVILGSALLGLVYRRLVG